MKYLMIGLAAAAVACNSPEKSGKKAQVPDSVTMIPTDTMVHITDTTFTPVLVESWQAFEQYNGKYSSDVKMLSQKPLKERMKLMLLEEEGDFVSRFKVSPPVEVDNGTLFNEGCKPHECGVEEAAIAIDMNKDVIYIGIARNKAVRLYGERGDTAYPDKLLQWMMKFEK